MRTKPDYPKAKQIALKSLLSHQIVDFPIDILSILESYNDIKIISYSEMAKKRGLTFNEIVLINGSTDGVIHYSANRDKYFIAYNDNVHLKERVYWTLAHEYGHYMLEHHKETARSSLARNGLTEIENEVFEREANFFSRFFISPPYIITETNMNNYEKIMSFFGISFTAATNTLNYIKNSYNKGFKFQLPRSLMNYFNPFIDKVINGATCENCNTFYYFKNANYCPICGSGKKYDFYRGEDISMYYPGVSTDEDYKTTQCPRCANEEIVDWGDYCPVCGLHLINKCSNEKVNPIEGNDDCHVGPLPSNYRFCPNCSESTTFFNEGVLDHWEYEKSNKQEEKNHTSIDINDDTLPF